MRDQPLLVGEVVRDATRVFICPPFSSEVQSSDTIVLSLSIPFSELLAYYLILGPNCIARLETGAGKEITAQ